eukprot:CAMPEP_0198214840 /NCGR_PEP_ID=MMETSP1445-20131203/44581_1 /TAXON_ID=36898 /ORGANISM="Pyramimonas sp., Strain CCMP2087" /LENGTH=111 /DNA_ID=CAMNT_0043890207 /DNA_START=655 /DNA_END=987 /DNA_ORIENTATION=-
MAGLNGDIRHWQANSRPSLDGNIQHWRANGRPSLGIFDTGGPMVGPQWGYSTLAGQWQAPMGTLYLVGLKSTRLALPQLIVGLVDIRLTRIVLQWKEVDSSILSNRRRPKR